MLVSQLIDQIVNIDHIVVIKVAEPVEVRRRVGAGTALTILKNFPGGMLKGFFPEQIKNCPSLQSLGPVSAVDVATDDLVVALTIGAPNTLDGNPGMVILECIDSLGIAVRILQEGDAMLVAGISLGDLLAPGFGNVGGERQIRTSS